jgi:hypothetical protein
MENLQSLIDRTEFKIKYALVHLNELKTYKNRGSGDDFERSHHESYLFHLHGVLDAFLQEINLYYDLKLYPNQVKMRKLKNQLKKDRKVCPELEKINELEGTQNSWLRIIKEMRHHSTHRYHIVRHVYAGGQNDGRVELVNPDSRKKSNKDVLEDFEEWQQEMEKLITDLRKTATKHYNEKLK